ncbi:hypothetical protein DQP55_25010 [Mycolicibacterium sp. GF69]|uniref:hypothetical protein n=1 Tax=Mycolicibacterium sp. GF69 TaxID=2267251 RepID=UPI000DCCA81B|nr:hypothetical protein [Mycolicibacterium sp. GF69]RAV05859.1 hypothetical protein DQP55_25010 [Mycolicibacterium sp. GF69]
MAVAVGTRAMRHLTVALASVAAVSLTVMSAGGQPASAQPTDTTYPTETAYAPTEEAPVEAPPAYEAPTYQAPTYEAPPEVPTPAAPEVPTQAPVVTPQTQEPVVTEAPAEAPETQAPAVVTTTAAPQVTPEPDPQTTAEATPQPTPTTPMPTPTTRTSAPAEATTGVTTTGVTTTVTTPSGSPADTTSVSPASGPTTATTPSSGASTPAEESVETTSEVVPAGGGGSSDSSELTRSAELAAGVTQTPEPQRAEASPQDIKTAQQATPVKEDPPPAPPAEIDRLRDLVLPLVDPDASGPASVAAEGAAAPAEPKVLQWQPDWVQYDQYFRPLIFNPYPEPLRVVYDVGGVPRILIIPPLGRIVTEVRDLGSYNFTALRLNPLGLPIDVAVGNFFGGGYFPGPGLPPPPPPPPVRTLTDVPVQVKYTNATYRPIVVRKLVDVGPDPAVGGAHKVLLDGATPAWGEWKQNDSGVPQFEVHQTQSFPGMEAPAEGPLPGNYDLQLVSDSVPTGFSGKDITLIIVAAIVAAVGVGAIFMTVFRGRRRRIRH